jgi:beta-lactamase regulating signal transducer with metallopeptidase domain
MVELPFTPGPVHAGTWIALLLEAALKGTLVLMAVAFAMRFLRRGTAAVRHWILTCATAGILALPVLSVLLPVWPVPIFPDTALWSYAVAKVGSPDPSASTRLPAQPPAPRASPPSRDASLTARPPLPPWRTAMLLIWAAGAGLFLLRLLAGTASARRMARRATPFADARLTRAARHLARRIRLDTPVRILRSVEIETPLTLGVFEPVIILPFDADRWSEPRLRVALLHELSHVKRHDCFAQFVADIACAFYWFHPIVWHTARRLRLEREHACDDCVLQSGVKPSLYAAHLLQLACALSSRAVPRLALPMAHVSQIESRLRAILDPHVNHHAPSRAGFAAALLFVLSIIIPLAALDPWAAPAAHALSARVATAAPLLPF